VRRRWALSLGRCLTALRLWLGVPSLCLLALAVVTPEWPFVLRASVAFVALLASAGAFRALEAQVTRPLGAVANVLEGLRRGERGLRVVAIEGTALYDVHTELNQLAESIHTRHLADRESSALLSAILRELDVAVLAFARDRRLVLLNPAAEALLGKSQAQAVGKTAGELGVEAWLLPEQEPGRSSVDALRGPFALRRIPFRREGEPHELVVVTHLGGALRSEERQAWQRLLRVLSHEINNSLSPIITIADAHEKLIKAGRLDASTMPDVAEGLDVIGRRASGLRRFLGAFAQLTRLPPPTWAPLSAASLLRRVAALETRLDVVVDGPGDPTLVADRDQLEQLFVNLVRNAADAALGGGGHVALRWQVAAKNLVIEVEDDGPGLASDANLFVPFFTTKPLGSGIGLVLSRAIAESHGGSVDLLARSAGPGCIARVVLPLDAEASVKRAMTRTSLPRAAPS
jgi:two-component system, NtrC family, nitrogen regulation sensor histidine kinase NtrY